MGIRPFFEDIEEVIINDIKASKKELLIAVAWFTNHKIYDAIIDKLNENHDYTAKLIIINDNINHRIGGLDFDRFVSVGGVLYFAEKNIPMHNKYMVVDSSIVITGSYNYTYYAETLNEENIVRIDGNSDIVESYTDNFNRLVEKKPQVTNVDEYLSVFPPAIDMLSYNNYALKDISIQSEHNGQSRIPFEPYELKKGSEVVANKERNEYFVIKNVIYEQWKDYYYIDKIEVRGNRVVVTFKTTISHGNELWAPGTVNAWFIRSTKDNSVFSECYAIRDVYINSEIAVTEIQKGTIYIFREEGQRMDKNYHTLPVQYVNIPNNSILTCDVYFIVDNTELINGMIDLIEGKNGEKKKDHWNAFGIQMNLNRE